MKKISAISRSVVKNNYALITPDSYVTSVIPGWENCDIRVVISPDMGACFSQHLIKLIASSKVRTSTGASEIFLYVIDGECRLSVGETNLELEQGGFVFIPPQRDFGIESDGAELLSFQKVYEPLPGYEQPEVISGNSRDFPKSLYLEDPQLQMQYLLPDNLSMDMAVNIFSYHPGGNLPFVEVHIMEHGLLYLAGQGIYRLDDDWHPVQKGDVIWMAPYCPQWFTAMGKEDAVYIYYKNVNRPSLKY